MGGGIPKSGCQAVELGDVDLDGDLDVMFGWLDYNRLYENDGSGHFTDLTATHMPGILAKNHTVLLADIDGDGDPDAFNTSSARGTRATLYLNDGGTFVDVTALPNPQVIGGLDDTAVLADLDGDADLDIATVYELLQNDGAGHFSQFPSSIPPWRFACDLALADVDGDGDLDAVSAEFSNAIHGKTQFPAINVLAINDGSGAFTRAPAAQWPYDAQFSLAVCAADADADGDVDVYIGNSTTTPVLRQDYLYLNDGSGRFHRDESRLPGKATDTAFVTAGDIDRDGDNDFVVLGPGHVDLYLNRGGGYFTDVTAGRLPPSPATPVKAALADGDGDGDLDLVLGSQGPTLLYENDGSGRFADVTAGRIPSYTGNTMDLVVLDLDEDGDVDIVVAQNFETRLFVNDGSGNFADASGIRIANYPACGVVAGDVDGDRDPDLLLYEPSRGLTALHYNLQRQLSTPLRPRVGRPHRIELWAEPGYGSGPRGGAVFLALGLAPAPLQLPGLGSIFVRSPLFPLANLTVSPSTGLAATDLQIPAGASLVGAEFALQGIAIHGSTAHLTNFVRDRIKP